MSSATHSWKLNRKTLRNPQQRFRSEADNLFTVKFSKILLSVTDDKIIQTLDGVTTSPFGYRC